MTETLPALRKTYSVNQSAARAFEIFTRELAQWWPVGTHSLSGREGKQPQDVRVEPRLGGRISEIRHDGNVAPWGTITTWAPGRRLGVDWYVGRSPTEATHYEIAFRDTPQGCDVELVHGGFEIHGTAGEAMLANYDEGWDMVLGECFRRACAE